MLCEIAFINMSSLGKMLLVLFCKRLQIIILFLAVIMNLAQQSVGVRNSWLELEKGREKK